MLVHPVRFEEYKLIVNGTGGGVVWNSGDVGSIVR